MGQFRRTKIIHSTYFDNYKLSHDHSLLNGQIWYLPLMWFTSGVVCELLYKSYEKNNQFICNLRDEQSYFDHINNIVDPIYRITSSFLKQTTQNNIFPRKNDRS